MSPLPALLLALGVACAGSSVTAPEAGASSPSAQTPAAKVGTQAAPPLEKNQAAAVFAGGCARLSTAEAAATAW